MLAKTEIYNKYDKQKQKLSKIRLHTNLEFRVFAAEGHTGWNFSCRLKVTGNALLQHFFFLFDSLVFFLRLALNVHYRSPCIVCIKYCLCRFEICCAVIGCASSTACEVVYLLYFDLILPIAMPSVNMKSVV